MDADDCTAVDLTDEDLDDAEEAIVETFARDLAGPVAVLDGYGLSARVDGGRLVLSDGMVDQRRVRRFARATHGLARVVVLGHSGDVSLDALRWCAGAGIAVVVLDPSTGAVLTTSGAVTNDDARLRRAQALAPGTETGLVVARYLTGAKLGGQASIAAHELDAPEMSASIERLRTALDDAGTLEEVRQLEASAANLYWSAWERVELSFVSKDKHRIPEHYRRFEGRRSAVNPGTARNATDPANACLNLAYRLVEAEGRLATQAVGLDPGLGILHADVRGRDSFVLDVMEIARPLAERHVLRLIRSQSFRRRDFTEDERGVVRVLPPLTHRIAEAMASFGQALGPVVEHVAQLFGSASPYDVSTPSVLTKSKHREASRRRVGETGAASRARRAGQGPGAKGLAPRGKTRQRPTISPEAPLPIPICCQCGEVLPPEPDRERRRGAYCARCLADRRAELGATMQASSLSSGRRFADRTGARPTHTKEATERRSQTNAARRAEQAAWDAAHAGEEHDAQWFTDVVVPGLAEVTLPTIAKATGMSTSAASKVRAGRRVPHPRHWEVLAAIAGGT